MTRIRHLAVHLALAAMILRALLPVGWMPDPAGSGPFVICTMDGPVQQTHHTPGKPSPDDGHSHEECPFAAAPHVAAPATVALLVPPSLATHFIDLPQTRTAAAPLAAYQPQSPRAPPRAA